MRIPSSLRWKFKENLGSGAQAHVALVTDSSNEFAGNFALKGLASGKPLKAYQRFTREIDAIKKLNHANIVKIVDHSNPDDEFQFYVMEYLPGARSLKKLLDSDTNPFHRNPVNSLNLFCQLSSAIEAWRGERIVHRDLSPANVLISEDLNVKVIDFGICQTEGEHTITLIDEGVGSRNYTAPECEAGAGGDATIAADFYSAGKLLWTAITNEYAFAREAPAFKYKSMSAMFPNDPQTWHLQHIFEKTIRQSIADRFSNGEVACDFAKRVLRLVTSGFSPLLYLQSLVNCPLCGWGTLSPAEECKEAIGNRDPIYGKRTIEYVRCDYCGLCMAMDSSVFQKRLTEMDGLN